MTSKAERRVKKLVKKLSDEWMEALGLDSLFVVTHRWCETGMEGDNDAVRTAADTTSLWEYRYIKIRWYLPNICNLSKKDLREVVVHEILHGLLASIEQHVPDKRRDHGEYAVELMTTALCHLRFG